MAEDSVALAFQAYYQGKIEEARELCERLLHAEPAHAPALMLLGLIAKKRNRFEDAASLLERSVQIESNPLALTSLADCLWRIGRLDEGLRYIEEAITRQPDSPEAQLVGAMLLHGLRRFDAALERVRCAQTLLPESHLVEARLGCISTQLGRYEDAERHFRNVARLMPKFGHCRAINFGQEMWREIEPRSGASAAEELEPLREASIRQPYAAVVAAFCDVRYFYKYGVTFVNSFAQNAARDKLLHLHILDPEPGFAAYLDHLIARVRLQNVVVTVERAPLADATHNNSRKTFYSCARFIHMGWLLQYYKTTIACFDIDTVFETPIDAMIASVKGGDVGLIQREPPDSPWLDIIANIVIANQTEPAQRYFAAVRNFIRHFAGRGELFWHLDQIALYCVLKMMERFSAPPRVDWITQRARAAVFHIGNPYDFRLQDARVARYQLADLAAKAEPS